MACTYTSASVRMEVLVKKNELVPIGIRPEFLNAPIDRPLAFLIPQENLRKSARKLGGDIPQREHVSGPCRELNFEIVAEVMMELLQRFYEKKIDRKPNRPAPVGIATKESCARFCWLVINTIVHSVHCEHVRIVPVITREGTNSVRR